jgi:integrase/recombinase XerD
MPFDQAQIDSVLAVADSFTAKGQFGRGNRDRIRAMIQLLRYSGLRISDAAVLERRRVSGDKLFLYTQNTGTPVLVPLPPKTVEALNNAPSDNNKYFFWNGSCLSVRRPSSYSTFAFNFPSFSLINVRMSSAMSRSRVHCSL